MILNFDFGSVFTFINTQCAVKIFVRILHLLLIKVCWDSLKRFPLLHSKIQWVFLKKNNKGLTGLSIKILSALRHLIITMLFKRAKKILLSPPSVRLSVRLSGNYSISSGTIGRN